MSVAPTLALGRSDLFFSHGRVLVFKVTDPNLVAGLFLGDPKPENTSLLAEGLR